MERARLTPFPREQATTRICMVSSFATELLEIRSREPSLHVLFIPGNPGIAAFYKDFVEALYENLGGQASITAIGHISHGQKGSEHGRLFSLHEQIDHKVDFIEQELLHSKQSIVLVGHSIGAYIGLEIFKRLQKKVRTVFIDGLSPSWDEDRDKKYLKKYGAIEKIELARNMPAARRKDFGFVTFDTHDNAVVCADGITNCEIGEGDNKAKVRARLSRPIQRPPRMKHGLRGNFRIGHSAPRGGRFPYARPPPLRRPPPRIVPPDVSRLPPIRSRPLTRPVDIRDRRPVMPLSDRVRPMPPLERSYDRRPPAPVYPKRSPRREYVRRDELPPPRSRATFADYSSRVPVDRRPTYKDDYSPRGSAYSDIGHRSAPRFSDRRAYADDDGYGGKIDRPLPIYREGRGRDYDTMSGSKRSYAEMDDAPPRYHDVSVRQSKARLDYDVGGSSARYADAYSERLGRSHVGYSGSRSLSGHDSVYSSSRHGMSYGGSASSGDAGGMYSSNFSESYMSRGSDVGGSSYSKLYSGRNTGSSSGYFGGSGSSSYY